MPVTVKAVESRKELRAFVKFPLDLYKDCPYFVPGLYMDEMKTLDPEKNPMGKYSVSRKFLAYKDGKLAGRVMACMPCCSTTLSRSSSKAASAMGNLMQKWRPTTASRTSGTTTGRNSSAAGVSIPKIFNPAS